MEIKDPSAIPYLTRDTDVAGLLFSSKNSPKNTSTVNLGGRTLRVGSGGFHINTVDHIDIEGGGVLTSNASFINITTYLDPLNHNAFDIHVAITDNGSQRVGLNITGSGAGSSIVELVGSSHNTYTGDTLLSRASMLNLIKNNDVTAVNGDLMIREGSSVNIFRNEQINNKSRVFLESNGVTVSSIRFVGTLQKNIKETIAELSVSGSGAIEFGAWEPEGGHGTRHLFLDNLIIDEGSQLTVLNWLEGRDYLLVKKNSTDLADALKRIKFAGYDPNNLHLESYNEGYWMISGAPEPSTYGAGLVLSGLSFTLWRRKRGRRRNVECC